MRVLHSIDQLADLHGPIVLAIGVFDGVHLGHKAVLERAAADAKKAGGTAVVVTFDPHPMRVVRPEQAPRLLTSTPHKIRYIEQLGVSHLLIIPFTGELAATTPKEFIVQLHKACRPLREICVGHQWSFGRGRSGNLQLLQRLGDELGFDEVGVEAVQVDGQIVSSTLIRAAVETGDLAAAARFLGREFTVLGTVVAGAQLGRQMGFPTANLSTQNEQFPPSGVYAAMAVHRGKTLRGIVNIGVRPTVAEAGRSRLLELHIFDFDEQIYGDEVEVTFKQFIREEKKFPSVEDLRAQIGRDVATARQACR